MTGQEREAPLLDHLGELRDRLVRIAVALVVGFGVCYTFRIPLFDFLTWPVWNVLSRHGIHTLRVLDVTEAILMYLKVSLIGGLIVSAPYTLHQVWSFVAPGLYGHEKRHVALVLVPSLLFFAAGLAFAYGVMIPFAVDFLVGYALENPTLAVELTVRSTVGFELTFLLVFALVFELPLIMTFVAALGVADHRTYLRHARVAVVVAFVVGALLTPPDVVSQALLAGPLILLYALGVGGAWVMHTRRQGGDAMAAVRRLAVRVLLLVALLGVLAWWGLRPLIADATSVAPRAVLVSAVEGQPADAWPIEGAWYPDRVVRPAHALTADAWPSLSGLGAPDPAACFAWLPCAGRCLWLEAPGSALRALLPTLAPMAGQLGALVVACEGRGADATLALRLTVSLADPWTRHLLARSLLDEARQGGAAPWRSGVDVRAAERYLELRAPMASTACGDLLHHLAQGAP